MCLKKIAVKLGIDKAILFTSSSTLIGAIGNVASAVLVMKFLSLDEQGYYFTFGSIVAIQIFFELGLNGIITQFVAHENAKLKWQDFQICEGNQYHKSRLTSLLHFCIRWYSVFSMILIIVLIPLGVYFFGSFSSVDDIVLWKIPWLLLAISTALNLFISPFIAFLQGLGKVKEIANFQLLAQVLRIIIICVCLILGFKLYVLGIGNFILFFVMLVSIFFRYKMLFLNIWFSEKTTNVEYFKEIFPFQWKIALSWLSGYFIFQLFNPVLFATEGSKVAGQMGLTLTALNGILTLSIAWMTTKVPLLSSLIANKKFDELDNLFNRTLKQALFINIVLLTTFVIFISVIKLFKIAVGHTLIVERFISMLPLVFMTITVLINLVVSSWAIYLRCHKEDPYFVNSLVSGILSALSTIYCG